MALNASSLIRWYATVRHLKWNQISGRLLYRARQRKAIKQAQLLVGDVDSRSPERSRPISTDNPTVDVLGRRISVSLPIDWVASDRPYLDRFNLHYHKFLNQLSDSDSRAVVDDWIRQNPVGLEPGWHPYPTSLRIISWIRSGVVQDQVQDSLLGQAEYLYHLTETHLGGNHLLENARALMFAWHYFRQEPHSDKWKDRALRIYGEELEEQVLSDGGHYERSPMYHSIVLEGVLDTISLLRQAGEDIPEWLTDKAKSMLDYTASLVHPDGDIPLFNDSTQEIAMPSSELVEYGRTVTGYEPRIRTNFPETGYFVHSSNDFFFCIDAGPLGPDNLPAHAHGDIFSFELSCNGDQIIVDSGVYEYESGEMRDYVRSSRAHNTVTVDECDQAEFWSSFRVARRYNPSAIVFNSNDKGFDFGGSFDGYSHLIGDGIRHERRVSFSNSERVLEIEDRIAARGNHVAASRIHLHPDVDIRHVDGGLRLRRGNTQLLLESNIELRLEDSWYCPEFGTRIANTAIVAETHIGSDTAICIRLNCNNLNNVRGSSTN